MEEERFPNGGWVSSVVDRYIDEWPQIIEGYIGSALAH